MGVFPVLNCVDFASIKQRIEAAKKFLPEGSFLHCDIADGTLTFNKTWNNPTDWANLRAPYQLEAHLMVDHPEKQIEPWIAAGVRRLIVHAEAVDEESIKKITAMAAARGVGIALSSNPETTIDRFAGYLRYFQMVQVLCVHAGLAGQNFLELPVEKIKWLRREWPNVIIEVDGGMNPETAKIVKDAGANFIVSSNYVFGGSDPGKAYRELANV